MTQDRDGSLPDGVSLHRRTSMKILCFSITCSIHVTNGSLFIAVQSVAVLTKTFFTAHSTQMQALHVRASCRCQCLPSGWGRTNHHTGPRSTAYWLSSGMQRCERCVIQSVVFVSAALFAKMKCDVRRTPSLDSAHLPHQSTIPLEREKWSIICVHASLHAFSVQLPNLSRHTTHQDMIAQQEPF